MYTQISCDNEFTYLQGIWVVVIWGKAQLFINTLLPRLTGWEGICGVSRIEKTNKISFVVRCTLLCRCTADVIYIFFMYFQRRCSFYIVGVQLLFQASCHTFLRLHAIIAMLLVEHYLLFSAYCLNPISEDVIWFSFGIILNPSCRCVGIVYI